MHRNVTAIYRTHGVADQVRRELVDLGISRSHVHVVPDTDDVISAGSYRDDTTYRDDLGGLGLPDEERHTYEQAVRRGDYIVSVRVNENDEGHMGRITEIMRHPEAHDFDALDTEFRDAPRGDYGTASGTAMGRRDRDYDYGGSNVRGYAYDDPYSPRGAAV